MAVQELRSGRAIHKILSGDSIEYDIILDYNTIMMGRNAAKFMPSVPRVLDLADDIADMVRISPRLPSPIARIAGTFSGLMISRSIKEAALVTGTTDSLLKSYKVPEEKKLIVPNGVPEDFLKTDPRRCTTEHRNDDPSLVVGYVGVLREWVDFRPILEAFRIIEEDVRARLEIIGGEGEVSDVRTMAESKGLTHNLLWHGTIPHEEISRYMTGWDCGIIPFIRTRTTDHALPLKLFEYFACGLPVISTKVNGIIESFGNEVAFYDDAEGLAEILRSLDRDPAQAIEMGRRGREKCVAQFSWEKIVSDFAVALSNVATNRANLKSARIPKEGW